jgi:hypothetical protein
MTNEIAMLLIGAAVSLVSTTVTKVVQMFLDDWKTQLKEKKERKKKLSQSIIKNESDYRSSQTQIYKCESCQRCKNRLSNKD